MCPYIFAAAGNRTPQLTFRRCAHTFDILIYGSIHHLYIQGDPCYIRENVPIQRLASSLSAMPQILLQYIRQTKQQKLLRDGLLHRTLFPKCRPSTENSDSCGTRLLSDRERATGIEPAYPAWKAGALAVVLCPQKNQAETLTCFPDCFHALEAQ